MKLKREDKLFDIAIEKIENKYCDEDQITYFFFTKLELGTGYEYQFIFQFGDNAAKHLSDYFVLQGKYDFIFIKTSLVNEDFDCSRF